MSVPVPRPDQNVVHKHPSLQASQHASIMPDSGFLPHPENPLVSQELCHRSRWPHPGAPDPAMHARYRPATRAPLVAMHVHDENWPAPPRRSRIRAATDQNCDAPVANQALHPASVGNFDKPRHNAPASIQQRRADAGHQDRTDRRERPHDKRQPQMEDRPPP